MIIECPACHTRAKIPDSKEGAKVRCGQCGRVYAAYPGGAKSRGKRTGDPTVYFIIGGAVVLLAVILLIANRSTPPPLVAAVEEERAPRTIVATTGWDSPLVVLCRQMHDHAFVANSSKLRELVDGERAWAFFQENPPPSRDGDASPGPDGDASPDGDAAVDGEPGVGAAPEPLTDARAWAELRPEEQAGFESALVERLVRDEAFAIVNRWKPYATSDEAGHGVVTETDDEAVVRLQLAHRDDPALPSRNVEWRLVKEAGRWRPYGWMRWISPEELAAQRAARKSKIVRRTLSDGSNVVEGEVRPIPWMEETSEDDRARIDALIAKILDLNIPGRELAPAREELIAYGKPAIPALLTQIALIDHAGEEERMKLNQVHIALTDITGHLTSFKPHVALGATEERIDSGLKQWFGWYDTKFRRFEGREKVEAELKPLNDRDRKLLEDAEMKERFGIK